MESKTWMAVIYSTVTNDCYYAQLSDSQSFLLVLSMKFVCKHVTSVAKWACEWLSLKAFNFQQQLATNIIILLALVRNFVSFFLDNVMKHLWNTTDEDIKLYFSKLWNARVAWDSSLNQFVSQTDLISHNYCSH